MWVATEVLQCTNAKLRKEALRRWIDVAHACRQLNNLGTTVRGIFERFDEKNKQASTLTRTPKHKHTHVAALDHMQTYVCV